MNGRDRNGRQISDPLKKLLPFAGKATGRLAVQRLELGHIGAGQKRAPLRLEDDDPHALVPLEGFEDHLELVQRRRRYNLNAVLASIYDSADDRVTLNQFY